MENNELVMFERTVKYSNDVIFIKPLCDLFNISYENQCRVISNDEILQTSSTKKSDKMLFGDKRERVCLTKKGFIRWIQLINPQIVQVSLKENFIKYQILIFDYLYGNVEKEDLLKIKYARLKKLKSLYGKIGYEIQQCQLELNGYVEERLGGQKKLFLKD